MGREHRVSHRADPDAVELLDAIGRIEASPPLPERPAIVLSADKPWAIPGARRTRTDKRGNDHVCRVAGGSGSARGTLHAAHVAETHSGHNIYLYQPGLVVDTIRKVVGKVRHLS